ncbi:ATP-binding cassette domain-containing protein [Conexibacter arvalis]|uniref:Putative ABC transport system ATP-binding protein n=1 Tax=Conexibacter arvalis TaxID=912552 RepID=A0A840ID55_9ACTN|nr:putative ABC transport system ATP-binding protein [Conexibacter arvalis]
MLRFEDVSKTYRAGDGELICAADRVSLTVEAGEMVALYGPSGSGKTTLLELAAALLRPDSGAVTVGGLDIGRLSPREADAYRLATVGYVFQDSHLIPGVSAADNAAVKLLAGPMPLAQARRTAAPWLERVGLGHRQSATPQQLSGGERQRVAIAAALANEPALILADEPTGSLDSRTARGILDLLASIAHERRAAVLLVTHDPQGAEVADRALRLRDGRLIEDDPAPSPGTSRSAEARA